MTTPQVNNPNNTVMLMKSPESLGARRMCLFTVGGHEYLAMADCHSDY